MKSIKHLLILSIVMTFIFSASFAFAEGSVPNNGWKACLRYNSPNNFGITAPTPIEVCQSLVPEVQEIGASTTLNSTSRANCGITSSYVAYFCLINGNSTASPYQQLTAYRDNTICSANSTFNASTNQCDCASGYEPDQAGTACVQEPQETQQTCEAQGKYWNAINSTCFDNVCQSLADGQTVTELTVQVTSDASQPVTINPQLYEYGFFNGCRYYLNEIPTQQNLNCFTIVGDVDPKDGFCNFNYVATGQNASQGGDASLLADASANADNEVCEGNAEKNDFGMCMEDTTVQCDPETEWHNYGNNTCEAKQECGEDQEYFFNETVQGCQDLACPAGEFRPAAGQPCQAEGSCPANNVTLGVTCVQTACPDGQYRVTTSGQCQAIPEGHELVRSPFPAPTSQCAATLGLKAYHVAGTRDYRWPPNNDPDKSNWQCSPNPIGSGYQQSVCAAYATLTAQAPSPFTGFQMYGYGEWDLDQACIANGFTDLGNNNTCFQNSIGFNASQDCANLSEIVSLYNQGYKPSSAAQVQSGFCPAGQHISNGQWCIDDECTTDPYHDGNCNDSGQTGGNNNGSGDGTGGLAECPEGQDCGFNGSDLEGELDEIKADYRDKLAQIKTQFNELIDPIQTDEAILPEVGFEGSKFEAETNLETNGIDWASISARVMLICSIIAIAILLSGFQ